MNMEISQMLRSPTHSRQQRQRGVGALAVSLLLLFASSIVVFYLNRGLVFEQKTSANQVRSTSAFEMAEAGIEWATGMLNTASNASTACTVVGPDVSFAAKYAQLGLPANDSFVVTTNTFPGCKLNGTTLTCGCPALATGTANLGAAVLPSFTVAFAQAEVIDPVTGAVTTDPRALRLISTGCTAQAAACAPGATAGADANARVEVTLRFSPTLRAAPQAALTCGKNCNVGGSYRIENTEVSSNGYLVNAGTTITGGPGTNYQTIPGQPIQNAMIANDSSLADLSNNDATCSNSNLFKAYFGVTLAEYAALPNVAVIPGCTNPSTCGDKILAEYNAPRNARDFYFPDGMDLNNSSLPPPKILGANTRTGSVRLVSPADININGNITINGLLFSNSANFRDLGTGTADINGSIISCASYGNNGNGLLTYSSAAGGGTGPANGRVTRVPGSWRDFQ